MPDAYIDFLNSKVIRDSAHGFDVNVNDLHLAMFDYESAIVRWLLKKGRAALFADCGLGKTFMQLEWARNVCEHTQGDVLILAPLTVTEQTKDEAEQKWGIPVTVCRDGMECKEGINITNYEMLSHFDPKNFAGVVLDESSILKSYSGSIRQEITSAFQETPFRLACTATPAPNDHMELGTHAEFLGVMKRSEMLAMFFTHDGGETAKWRIKGHGEDAFWKWVSSWAVMLRNPADLGFDGSRFILPPINRVQIIAGEYDPDIPPPDTLTLERRRSLRYASLNDRVKACADLVNNNSEQFLVWCDLNAESTALKNAIPDSVEVVGSDSRKYKIDSIKGFLEGRIRVIVSKPSIYGFGMNCQCCWNMVHVGLSDSFEQMYQAERRCWRFGQTHEVNSYVITSYEEGAVVRNIDRKQRDYDRMITGMTKHVTDILKKEIKATAREEEKYERDVKWGENWTIHLGDCIDVMRSDLEAESIDFTIFSPPFASLYTYTSSTRDMGNSKNYEEFVNHFSFLGPELLRVTLPGRLVAMHCMTLPMMKERDGVIGLRDFRGDLVRAMCKAGFIYHSEVCIWKNPVTQMQRTKSIGLLHKQVKKDTAMSRMGLPDYLVVFRKPGENPSPIKKTDKSFPVEMWQQYASPVWMDIRESETLSGSTAKDEDDEKHICPLQLGVIRRAVELWTNPGDWVFSPFAGIGSEGYVALSMGRKFFGIELKKSYWKQAIRNLNLQEQDSMAAEA